MSYGGKMESKGKEKILYVVEAMGGGVFTYIVDLANRMCAYYEVYIAYGVRQQTPEDFLDYFDKRVHMIKVESFVRSINPKKDLAAIKEIKGIYKEIQPKIVHLHSSKAGVVGRLSISGRKARLFYTPHGYSFLMKNSNFLKRFIYIAIEKVLTLKKCRIIACSPGEYRETIKYLTKNADFIYNGIDLSKYAKNPPKEPPKTRWHQFTVYTVGRICVQKNPKQFNEIAKRLPDVRFIWIGDGELRDELTSENIGITGWTDKDTVMEISRSGDLFLLPSLWEGLPISLLEAMYNRKPCVVSNVIGNADVIQNGITGHICDTVDDFVKAIREIMEHRDEACIENAYELVRNRYNADTMCRRYIKVYNGEEAG